MPTEFSPEIKTEKTNLTPEEDNELRDLESRNRLISALDPGHQPLNEQEKARLEELRTRAGSEEKLLEKLDK